MKNFTKIIVTAAMVVAGTCMAKAATDTESEQAILRCEPLEKVEQIIKAGADVNLAPEQVGGKTLTFHCEKEEVVNAGSYRDENTYAFLQPGGDAAYVATWDKHNNESNSTDADGDFTKVATTYRRTGKNTATVTYEFEFSHGEGKISSWYVRTYELLFTSPTGGKATCTVTGKPTTIWADKLIYTGSFSLE